VPKYQTAFSRLLPANSSGSLNRSEGDSLQIILTTRGTSQASCHMLLCTALRQSLHLWHINHRTTLELVFAARVLSCIQSQRMVSPLDYFSAGSPEIASGAWELFLKAACWYGLLWRQLFVYSGAPLSRLYWSCALSEWNVWLWEHSNTALACALPLHQTTKKTSTLNKSHWVDNYGLNCEFLRHLFKIKYYSPQISN